MLISETRIKIKTSFKLLLLFLILTVSMLTNQSIIPGDAKVYGVVFQGTVMLAMFVSIGNLLTRNEIRLKLIDVSFICFLLYLILEGFWHNRNLSYGWHLFNNITYLNIYLVARYALNTFNLKYVYILIILFGLLNE